MTAAPRLAALRGLTSLRVGVDSEEAAAALAAAAPGLAVLIEVDSGQHRSGVAVGQVASLAVSCAKLGLTVAGAFTHPGHAYSAPSAAGDAARDERAALAAAGEALVGAGVLEGEPVLSGGSTPTASAGLAAPLTEVRPGTYVFGDRQQMHLSGLDVDDVALVVAARVVSVPRPGEAVLDAGSKALSSDRPAWLARHGLILEAPEATVAVLSEEHAVVRELTDAVEGRRPRPRDPQSRLHGRQPDQRTSGRRGRRRHGPLAGLRPSLTKETELWCAVCRRKQDRSSHNNLGARRTEGCRYRLPSCLGSGRSSIRPYAGSSATGRCRTPLGTTKMSPARSTTESPPSNSTRKEPSQHRYSSS